MALEFCCIFLFCFRNLEPPRSTPGVIAAESDWVKRQHVMQVEAISILTGSGAFRPLRQAPVGRRVLSVQDATFRRLCEDTDRGSVLSRTSASTSWHCLLYTCPSPRDISGSRMPSSA